MKGLQAPRLRGADPGSRAVLALAAVLLAPASSGATVAADLCSGNPCEVVQSATITAGSVLDFGGATDLRIGPGVTLTLAPGGSVQFIAGSILLQRGAVIDGKLGSEGVQMRALAGPLVIEGPGAKRARIDFARTGARVILYAAGDLSVDGDIDDGSGDSRSMIALDAGGILRIAGVLSVADERVGFYAGTVDAIGAAGLEMSGSILADSQSGEAEISLESGQDLIVSGKINAGGYATPIYGGGGGSLYFFAQGDIVLSGSIRARGRGGFWQLESTAWGGRLELLSNGGSIEIGGKADLRGGQNGTGGNLIASAPQGDVRQIGSSRFLVGSTGEYSSGSFALEIEAGRDVRLARIDSSAGATAGLSVVAGREIVVAGRVTLRGWDYYGYGGNNTLEACKITIDLRGRLDSRSRDRISGSNRLDAAGQITIAGSLLAPPGGDNVLTWKTTPPIVTGVIFPTPQIVQSSSLPDCPP